MPNVSLSEESGGVNVMLRNRGGIGWKAGGAEKGQPQGPGLSQTRQLAQ